MDILHNGAIALYHGDCLDVMRDIPDGSVDSIICDLPYGVTSCKWDSVIPFEPMWIHLKRIIKPRGAIVLFGSQPFTSALVMSNVGMFKYQWVWEKERGTGFARVAYQPMRVIEDICVFSLSTPNYYPMLKNLDRPYKHALPIHKSNSDRVSSKNLTGEGSRIYKTYTHSHPVNLLRFARDSKKIHPTQKPVALLEYLIRTYTNADETVLDFTFGSCSAGVAALNTKRRFIGIERDAAYYALGVQRVQTAIDNLPPMDV